MRCWINALKLGALGIVCFGLGLPAQAQEVLFAITLTPTDVYLLTIDPQTGGILRSVPVTDEVYLRGLSYDGISLWSTDQYRELISDKTFRIDPETGAGVVVGNTGFTWNFRSVEVDPRTGILYGMTDVSTPDRVLRLNLFTIDKNTGAATRIFFGTAPTLDQATAMAIDSNGTLYFTDIGGAGLFRVDLSTFQVTHLGNLNVGGYGTGKEFDDLAFDRSGQLWGALSDGSVYTIDIDQVTAQFRFRTIALSGIAFSAPNTPPVAVCKDVTVPAGPSCSAGASIDNGSFDPDGGPLTRTQDPEAPYPLGDTLVRLTVADDQGASDVCEATVTVEDVTGPTIQQLSASPKQIWPPDHRMVSVRVNALAVDNCFPAICRIASVRSNEPVHGLGDGDTAPDWQILTTSTVSLRAERSGRGSGRIYTIQVECTDRAGNQSSREVAVSVPHDRGRK